MRLKFSMLAMAVCLALMGCGNDPQPQPEPEPQPQPQPEPEPEPEPTPEPPFTPGTPVFEDQFDEFDSSVWSKEAHPAGWTNNELQAYVTDNVKVGKDGERTVLMLTASRVGTDITSGRVNSKGKLTFKYGTVEACIRFPKTSNGLWPAFWMMGNEKDWPACGEVDIVEMGNADGIKAGTGDRHVNTAIHYGPSADKHEQQYFAGDFDYSLQDGNYHTYTLKRDANTLQILIDQKVFHTFDVSNNEYFKGDLYVLFNLAVGGDFTGIYDVSGLSALNNYGKVSMYVDWIRIFDK